MIEILVISAAILGAVFAEQFSYDGYKLYRVMPLNTIHVQALETLNKHEYVDFWTNFHVFKESVDFMVDPYHQSLVVDFLKKNDLKFEILIDNVESVFLKERSIQLTAPSVPKGSISFTKFNRYAEIIAYIDGLAKKYSKIASVEVIGKSYEGRELKVIKVSTNPNAKKPVIFIDAGFHVREWIAPAQVTYIINQLIENSTNAQLLENVDWHILPLFNPDGYEFTHTNKRLWRKTRSKGKLCNGTDPNRNFDFHWGGPGSSSYECSDTYKGPKPFSEVESQALRDYILKYKHSIKLYLTFHSYGRVLLYPWGYTSELPEDHKELQVLGESVAKSIRQVRNTVYRVGSSTNLTKYPAAGGSDDWVKGVAGIQLSYTVELPEGGKYGFDPPTSDIWPVVTETWAGVKTYHKYIQEKFSY